MIKKIILAVIAVFYLSSCMEGDVSINIAGDLSGTMNVNFLVSGTTEYLSSDLKTMGYQFVPLNGPDIQRITGQDDSLTLGNYKRIENGKDFSVSYSVDFSDLTELERLSGYRGGINTLSIDTSVPNVIKFTFKNPLPEDTSEQTAGLLASLYGDKILRITVKIAGFITETDTGALGEDPATAFYSFKVEDLLAEKSLIWTIKYTK